MLSIIVSIIQLLFLITTRSLSLKSIKANDQRKRNKFYVSDALVSFSTAQDVVNTHDNQDVPISD